MPRGGRSPLCVLIAGGGVAEVEATLALRALAEERVSVELVTPEADFTYRPLAVAEPVRVGEIRRFPLRPLVVTGVGSAGGACSGARQRPRSSPPRR